MRRLFLLIEAAAIADLLVSFARLPPRVASHFMAGGAANAFMPRTDYLLLMLTVTVLMPTLIAGLSALVGGLPPQLIHLPHKAYWLAPERRDATRAELSRRGLQFGSLLALFLLYTHELVIAANTRQPPQLSETAMLAGLVVFIALSVAWTLGLVLHFSRRR